MNVNDYSLWTALVTPFNSDLSVNWDDLEKLVRAQEEAGNGLLVLGSTGESLNLDIETKKQIVRFVKDLNPKTPMMVGVGGHQLAAQKSWIGFLEEVGIDAYLMVTPIYAKPGQRGQYQWFKTLMDLVTKPVMLYNVPSRTGTSLNYQAVIELNNHPNFWAIKEASGSVEDFKKYIDASGNGNVFSGDDGLTDDFCEVGGKGLVSVAANIWPAQTNRYVKECLSRSLQAKQMWVECSDALFTNGNPVTPKKLMKELGQISTTEVLPPLSSEDIVNAEKQLWANEQINNWFNS